MRPSASILFVDDDDPFRQVLSGELKRLGFAVTGAGSGEGAIKAAAAVNPEIVLLDLRLPDMSGLEVLKTLRESNPAADVIMLTGHGSIDMAIESIRAGAFDYVAKPCPLDELTLRIERAMERKALRQRTTLLERGLTPPDPAGGFVGETPEFRHLLSLVDRVAPSDSTVLITGETGSGKEVVAKLIHARSGRRFRPFVVVECASLQESLLQSELFGHERGAFTGAERGKPGLFEVAHGGTIFLDEIGEVSQSTQVQLLRVLDTSTFRHVGGTEEIHVDVRVIAATNRDLARMIAQGLFREDLYYRLSTIGIAVPPLRARRGDVRLLAWHFLSVLNERSGAQRRISPEAMDLLCRHDWPGNVRELQHVIESALVVSDDIEIRPEHLRLSKGGSDHDPKGPLPEATPISLADLERLHIQRVLAVTEGHRGRAARILGVSERNLYRKLREYGLLR